MTTHPGTDAREPYVDFLTSPAQYKHWKLTIQERVAILALDVQESQPLVPGYELKLNSYDLGVDIELYDATQRLRFEHPEVAVVVLTSTKPRVFCAGANIKMLAQASHAHKVNFCKFTNETRHAIEDATAHSGQTYLCAINGPAAGGGYELALACNYIMLIDDGSSTVSLPEVPLLAVLPGTGGLTRLVDKRLVRHDHADVLCTTADGIRGQRALDWRLVDELVPRSQFETLVQQRATALVQRSDRPATADGIVLTPLHRTVTAEHLCYEHVTVDLDRNLASASFTIHGPRTVPPQDVTAIYAAGASFWPLALARELDDAMLHLRLNEPNMGTWVLRSAGEHALVEAMDAVLHAHASDWLVREILLYLKRTLQRLDVSARSLIAVIAPGSCFTGTLLELVLAADRAYMLDGVLTAGDAAPVVRLSPLNFGMFPMVHGVTRLARRWLADPAHVPRLHALIGHNLAAAEAEAHGLVTFRPDEIDWEDEIRLALEERASFSPDALTGLEANLRFAGPETFASKIFGRLSAWQNWIFQRPNTVGDHGALTLYGTGKKSDFDKRRV